MLVSSAVSESITRSIMPVTFRIDWPKFRESPDFSSLRAMVSKKERVMIFRTGGSLSKGIIYTQIAALVMMLVGMWHLGLVLFIVASVMTLKTMKQADTHRLPVSRCIMSDEADDADLEAAERKAEKERQKREKKRERELADAQGASWHGVVEASVLGARTIVDNTDIPNGFVVMGPADKPVLVDFDDSGKLVSRGVEVEIGSWLKGLGDKIPEDAVILVHSVKGPDQILIRSLEVNRITKNGQPVTVREAARLNLLPKVVETLREKYIENMQYKEVEALLESLDEKDDA